jgi:phosphoglycolate phosphatase-like HAD superfamily hydrolase
MALPSDNTHTIPFDVIFFDFDGVLADSAQIKTNAFSTLYEGFGREALASALEYHAAHEGISRVVKIKHCHKNFLGIDLDEHDLGVLVQQYQNIVELAVIDSDWIDGARELLEHCQGQVPLFVASGTPEDELHRIVAARGMDQYFTEVRGSPDTKEVIVRDAADRYEFDPASALFLGDAMTDYNAARTCGCRFIGVVCGDRKNPFPDSTAIVPDLVNIAATF